MTYCTNMASRSAHQMTSRSAEVPGGKGGGTRRERNLSCIYDAICWMKRRITRRAEIELFKKLGGQLFAVADSRQQIYKGDGNDIDPLEAIRSAVPPGEHSRTALPLSKRTGNLQTRGQDREGLGDLSAAHSDCAV